MTADLLAQNVVAHWMQAAGVAGAAWLGVSVLRLREPGFLLKYWQAVLLVLLLAPWVQPWQPAAPTPAPGLSLVEPERKPAGVAGVSVAESVVALPAEWWSVDPWTWVLGLLAAVAVFRLVRLGLGLVRLGRLARSAHRVAPPTPARELLARFPTPATFIQPPDVRMPCSFGLFRPTVVLPAAFDRLEPAFQRGIVCHELLHLERRDFAAAMAEEVAAALLWFHPWAWLIRGRIRLHREQVVDAAVVRRTGDRRAYVRCLVALAGHPRALPLAAPMLRPTELRARADALFEKDGTMSKRASAALAVGLGAALAAAVWTAAATVPLSAAATTVPLSAAATTVPLNATPRGPAPHAPDAGQPSTGVTIALVAAARGSELPEPGFDGPPTGVTMTLVASARGSALPEPGLGQPPTGVTIALVAGARGPAPRTGAGRPAASATSRRRPRSTGADHAKQRATAVLQELQQTFAAMSDQLRNDETASEPVPRVTEMRERLAEMNERLAGQWLGVGMLLAGTATGEERIGESLERTRKATPSDPTR